MPELRISDSDVQESMGQALRHGITKQLSEYTGPWDDIAKREIPNLQGQFRIKNGFDSSVGRVADGGTAYDGSPRLAQTATYRPEILGGKLNISWGTLEALRGDGQTANDEIEDNMEVLRDTFTFVASAQLISNQLGTVKTLVNVGASTFDMDSMGAIEVGLVLWIYASSATSSSLPTHKLQVTQVSYVPMGTSTITFIDLMNNGSTLGVAIPAGSLIFFQGNAPLGTTSGFVGLLDIVTASSLYGISSTAPLLAWNSIVDSGTTTISEVAMGNLIDKRGRFNNKPKNWWASPALYRKISLLGGSNRRYAPNDKTREIITGAESYIGGMTASSHTLCLTSLCSVCRPTMRKFCSCISSVVWVRWVVVVNNCLSKYRTSRNTITISCTLSRLL